MASYVSDRRRRLSDAEIVRLYGEGIDSGTIGIQANCDPTTVLDLVRAAGETVRRPGGRPREQSRRLTDAEICQRYRSGQSGSVIADAASCAPSTIYNILARNNVVRRDATETTRIANTKAKAKRLRGRPAMP